MHKLRTFKDADAREARNADLANMMLVTVGTSCVIDYRRVKDVAAGALGRKSRAPDDVQVEALGDSVPLVLVAVLVSKQLRARLGSRRPKLWFALISLAIHRSAS